MPELPEVETVRRGLERLLKGRRLVRVEQRRRDLRVPFPPCFVERLTGQTVLGLRRRAKYLLVDLDGGEVLVAHLGMSGRMVVAEGPPGPASPHDHVVFETDTGQRVVFNDARRFGMMTLLAATSEEATHPLFATLGPEPLDPAFDGALLSARLTGKMTPIKAALLDQRVVAGIGNIYACEALFRARIAPRRMAATVVGLRAARLADAVRGVIAEAIEAGGSSLRDYVQADGELGYFQHRWAVYEHEGDPCPVCTTTLKRVVQSGRSAFYCPRCQR